MAIRVESQGGHWAARMPFLRLGYLIWEMAHFMKTVKVCYLTMPDWEQVSGHQQGEWLVLYRLRTPICGAC